MGLYLQILTSVKVAMTVSQTPNVRIHLEVIDVFVKMDMKELELLIALVSTIMQVV